MAELEETLGRRELKKRETRRAIRDAALDLALEHGLDHLTVEAIAQLAGVSPRTFFNYFESKEDALVTQAAEGAAQVRSLLLARPQHEPPMVALRHAVVNSDYFGADPVNIDQIRARQQLTQGNPALLAHHLGRIAKVEQTFASAMAERLGVDVDKDVYPQLLAAVAVGVIRVAVRRWVSDGEAPLYEFLEEAFDRVTQLGVDTQHATSAG